MTQGKRVHSIVNRISRGFLMRLVVSLLAVNLLLFVNAVLWSAYSAERAALGGAWQANLNRYLTPQPGVPFPQKLETLTYEFSLPGGAVHRVAAGPVLQTMLRAMAGLAAAEALLVFLQYRGAKRRVNFLTAPLRQMAFTAQQVSRERFDGEKAHALEHAIERLSVHSPAARLSTGDSELAGLETAVNNLITRMHDAYRQQIRFVSDASHELRTPISVIRGYADLLSRWGMDDRKVMEESVLAIRNEADNMQRLVEQLLFLARGDAGHTPFAPVPVDLNALARETGEEYALISPEHDWRVKEEAKTPALGDEAMLKQALRVLADNALKYSPPGSAVTLRAYTHENGMACLSVQDNGAGVRPEDLPHIFERFYRSDPARSRGGTGLGLSIAQWIAQRHGGYFDVFSREGMGTRFTLFLPPAEQAGAAAEDGAG